MTNVKMEAVDNIWNLYDTFKASNDTDNTSKKDTLSCEYCYSENISLQDGNYICRDCNCIADRFIDAQAEWRYYGHEDSKSSDPTRCGAPTNDLLPDSSLGSIISSSSYESYTMRMIRKYHMWNSMTYKERSLYNIFDSITINAVNNGISASIIEEAKNLYKQLSESRISRGENRSGLIASSIYMSCKSNKVPRSAKEIAKIFNLKTTTMTKGCKKFFDIMNMNVESSSAEDFIQRFSSKLSLPQEIREICKDIISKAEELNVICENTPPSIAAASIYLSISVCKLGITKKEVCDACELSMVTLSKCYKKLYTYRGLLLPKEIILKYNVT
jgi:transcription initiation factor TFIIB